MQIRLVARLARVPYKSAAGARSYSGLECACTRLDLRIRDKLRVCLSEFLGIGLRLVLWGDCQCIPDIVRRNSSNRLAGPECIGPSSRLCCSGTGRPADLWSFFAYGVSDKAIACKAMGSFGRQPNEATKVGSNGNRDNLP